MRNKIVLSPEQRKSIVHGEAVEANFQNTHGAVTIHPPCEETGHDWMDPRVVDKAQNNENPLSDDEVMLTRRCAICGDNSATVIKKSDLNWQ